MKHVVGSGERCQASPAVGSGWVDGGGAQHASSGSGSNHAYPNVHCAFRRLHYLQCTQDGTSGGGRGRTLHHPEVLADPQGVLKLHHDGWDPGVLPQGGVICLGKPLSTPLVTPRDTHLQASVGTGGQGKEEGARERRRKGRGKGGRGEGKEEGARERRKGRGKGGRGEGGGAGMQWEHGGPFGRTTGPGVREHGARGGGRTCENSWFLHCRVESPMMTAYALCLAASIIWRGASHTHTELEATDAHTRRTGGDRCTHTHDHAAA